jgi:hypothetical protein
MTRHLGRVSLLIAITCWFAFYASLLIGGLDPTPAEARVLSTVNMSSLLLVLVSACLAIIALARGPQRISAGFALALSILYGLVLTGIVHP